MPIQFVYFRILSMFFCFVLIVLIRNMIKNKSFPVNKHAGIFCNFFVISDALASFWKEKSTFDWKFIDLRTSTFNESDIDDPSQQNYQLSMTRRFCIKFNSILFSFFF